MPHGPAPGAHHHHDHQPQTSPEQFTRGLTHNLRKFLEADEDGGITSYQHHDAIESDIVACVVKPPQRVQSLLLEDRPLHDDNQKLFRELFSMYSDPPKAFIGIFGEISAFFSKKYEATIKANNWNAELMWRHLGKIINATPDNHRIFLVLQGLMIKAHAQPLNHHPMHRGIVTSRDEHTPSESSSQRHHGLSRGATIGIAVPCFVLAILAVYGCIFYGWDHLQNRSIARLAARSQRRLSRSSASDRIPSVAPRPSSVDDRPPPAPVYAAPVYLRPHHGQQQTPHGISFQGLS